MDRTSTYFEARVSPEEIENNNGKEMIPEIGAKFDSHFQPESLSPFDKDQFTTPAESLFGKILIHRLRQEGFEGDLSRQEVLPIPHSGKLYNKLPDTHKTIIAERANGNRYTIRKPDFLYLKYGLAIEIDGSIHEFNDAKIKKDASRDTEYSLLHIDCLVVTNADVYDSVRLGKILDAVVAHLKQKEATPDFEKERIKIRKRLFDVRKASQQWLTKSFIGRFDSSKSTKVMFPGKQMTASKQFNGWRITL